MHLIINDMFQRGVGKKVMMHADTAVFLDEGREWEMTGEINGENKNEKKKSKTLIVARI